MNKEFFEKVEYLRANANVSYEEATALLERYDGDLTRVMIELERDNRLYSRRENPWDNVFTRGKDHAEKCRHKHEHDHEHWCHNEDNWFHKLIRAKIRVNRNGEKLADVPVVAAGAVAVFCPYLAIAGAVGAFLMGCRVDYPGKPKQDSAE
ncbi:hypothetical protein AGMMS49992_13520 [Clostridia bacterium]|nr:hypothetical protein AGMMS49992_13520 [Clostridia bacterium]